MKRLGALALNLTLALFAVVAVIAGVEGALRAFPELLPKGTYGASQYRPELKSSVYGDTVVYNKVRFVARDPNSEGFLDVEHSLTPPPGVRRVGIFGDSYVESAQVPLDQAFTRLTEARLDPSRVEVLGFGMSGWGTLNALLGYEYLAPRYSLDAAVYVFVENDLGDNALEVQGMRSRRLSPKAFATLSPIPPGYQVVMKSSGDQLGLPFRIGKAVQQNLLLGRLVWTRVALLLRSGVVLRARQADREMSTRARGAPDQNDLPSSWPEAYADRARTLGTRILADWARQAKRDGRDLFVLYVPRGEHQLLDAAAAADTWHGWLTETCQRLGIPLIDPSDALRRRLGSGDAVYDDHWSPAGHEVIADVLSERLEAWVQRGAPRGNE